MIKGLRQDLAMANSTKGPKAPGKVSAETKSRRHRLQKQKTSICESSSSSPKIIRLIAKTFSLGSSSEKEHDSASDTGDTVKVAWQRDVVSEQTRGERSRHSSPSRSGAASPASSHSRESPSPTAPSTSVVISTVEPGAMNKKEEEDLDKEIEGFLSVPVIHHKGRSHSLKPAEPVKKHNKVLYRNQSDSTLLRKSRGLNLKSFRLIRHDGDSSEDSFNEEAEQVTTTGERESFSSFVSRQRDTKVDTLDPRDLMQIAPSLSPLPWQHGRNKGGDHLSRLLRRNGK